MDKKNGHAAPRSGDTGVLLIAIFKLFKGVVLLIAGTEVLSLINEDLAAVAARWVRVLHVGPDNRLIRDLLSVVTRADNQQLRAIGAGLFFYALLLLTEGTGLALRKHWAEYFSAIATASFLPIETYDLTTHFGAARILVIAINVAVVWYLAARIVARRREALYLPSNDRIAP